MEMATSEIPANVEITPAAMAPLAPAAPVAPAAPAAPVAASAGEATATDLGAVLHAWRHTLSHPSIASFQDHRAAANWEEVILTVCATGSATGLWLSHLAPAGELALGGAALPALCLLACAAFLAMIGCSYLGAKLMGGDGRFVEQAYLTSLGVTPLALVALVAQALPLVGTAIAVGAAAYALYLALLALRAAHHLHGASPTGPAVSWRYLYFVIGIAPAVAGFSALFFIYHLLVVTLPPVH